MTQAYIAGITGSGFAYGRVAGGSYTLLGNGGGTALNSGTTYILDFQGVQTNSTTTTLTGTVYASDGTTVISTSSITDTTTGFKNISGVPALFVFNAANAQGFTNFQTFTDIAATATAYTLSGPTSGTVGVRSIFTVTPNGLLSANTIITPSDSSSGGTFTPNTVTFISNSSTAQTFNYTASSAGTKTISTTNNGGLTNPSSVSFNAIVLITIGVISPAVHFSPGNWKGDTGRAGSVYHQFWNTMVHGLRSFGMLVLAP